jgi:NAD(P)-dependent dehydrogenase (short-subunit alcohol dehydrogenase family)
VKIALITGPSSGIGKATALEMARRGYHVVAAGRSRERVSDVVSTIQKEGGSAEHLHLDLASLSSCTAAGRTFAESGRVLDVLIDNAGVGAVRGLTDDGFEIHFGVNHLGHFMLNHHLAPSFRSGSRIVVVSSEAHRRAGGIDFDQVRRRVGVLGVLNAYAVSKLANILYAGHLAHLQPEWRTYAIHPGVSDTNIFPAMVKPFLRNVETPEQAAQTSVWCATSDEVANQSGLYYSRMKQRETSPAAHDNTLAAELWRRSEQWCGISRRIQ